MMGQCVTCGRPAEGDLCEYHNDPRTQWKTISDIEECFEEKITEKERLEARIARLEAEAVAQVELTTDLYDRITARDEGLAELEAALPRESWFSATLAHYNGCDDSYPITMPMTKGDVRRIRAALKGDADDEG